MGTLSTNEYDVAEAKQWCDYLDRIVGECRRLMTEKRVPESDTLDAFLEDSEVVLRTVKRDVSAAAARGDITARTDISMTSEEHKRLVSMSESMLNLLQILELRKAVVLDRTEAVGRVAAAIVGGTFTP
jgi:hypothetical protein